MPLSPAPPASWPGGQWAARETPSSMGGSPGQQVKLQAAQAAAAAAAAAERHWLPESGRQAEQANKEPTGRTMIEKWYGGYWMTVAKKWCVSTECAHRGLYSCVFNNIPLKASWCTNKLTNYNQVHRPALQCWGGIVKTIKSNLILNNHGRTQTTVPTVLTTTCKCHIQFAAL